MSRWTIHTHTLVPQPRIGFGIPVCWQTRNREHQVASSFLVFFHWNFKERTGGAEISFHIHYENMMQRLYSWADITSFSSAVHAEESNGVRWPPPPGGREVRGLKRAARSGRTTSPKADYIALRSKDWRQVHEGKEGRGEEKDSSERRRERKKKVWRGK